MRRAWGAPGGSNGLAADMRYTPAGGGASVDLRAMPVTKDIMLDDFGARTPQTGHSFDIFTADVPATPERGATLAELDAAGVVVLTYTLTEKALSMDSLRTVWRCNTGPGVP